MTVVVVSIILVLILIQNWNHFKLPGCLREKKYEDGNFFANQGHVSLGSASFKTNLAFLTMEQKC